MSIRKILSAGFAGVMMAISLALPIQAAPVAAPVSASAVVQTAATQTVVQTSVAQTAAAQRAFTDCAIYAGTVCFHERPDYTGRVWRQTPDEIGACRNFAPDNFDNQASTAFNNVEHSYSIRIYQYENCTGAYKILVSGYYYTFANDWWNDKPSSVRIIAALAE
jgi:hypothetical protein